MELLMVLMVLISQITLPHKPIRTLVLMWVLILILILILTSM